MKKIALTLSLLLSAFVADAQLVYHSAKEFPLLGTAVPNDKVAYSRLPDSLENKVRKELYDLGKNSAGLSIRFSSNTTSIGFKWKSRNKFNMNHMTPTGIRGLDLYAYDNGDWRFVGSARPLQNEKNTTTVVMRNMLPEDREYMLFLSLYDGVDSLYIGVDSLAKLELPKMDIPSRHKPIVMYGTSLLQGGCANRPGMCHTNILQRMLNREIYNFGFSGNGKLDLEVAKVMATVDAGLFVIDCLPNNKTPEFKEKVDVFFRTIRDAHPEVPILFVESPIFPGAYWDQEEKVILKEKNDALKEYFAKLQQQGEKNIHYFSADKIIMNPEVTVDNYHYTDLGFWQFAQSLYPVIDKIVLK